MGSGSFDDDLSSLFLSPGGPWDIVSPEESGETGVVELRCHRGPSVTIVCTNVGEYLNSAKWILFSPDGDEEIGGSFASSSVEVFATLKPLLAAFQLASLMINISENISDGSDLRTVVDTITRALGVSPSHKSSPSTSAQTTQSKPLPKSLEIAPAVEALSKPTHPAAIPIQPRVINLLKRDIIQTRLAGYPHTWCDTHASGLYIRTAVSIVSLSCRGWLDAEACESWGVPLHNWIFLCGRFPTSKYVSAVRATSCGENACGVAGFTVESGPEFEVEEDEGLLDDGTSQPFQFRAGLCESPVDVEFGDVLELFQESSDDFMMDNDRDRTIRLRSFLLSSPLREIMSDHFLQLLHYRLQHALGWRGAEELHRSRRTTPDFCRRFAAVAKGGAEARIVALAEDREVLAMADATDPCQHHRPRDGQIDAEVDDLDDLQGPPLDETIDVHSRFNVWLLAVRYSLRRIVHAPRFCLVCHNEVAAANSPTASALLLKPFVCENEECTSLYLEHGMGASLELDLARDPRVVELLINLAYVHDWSTTRLPKVPARRDKSSRKRRGHKGVGGSPASSSVAGGASRSSTTNLLAHAGSVQDTKALLDQLPSVRDMVMYLDWIGHSLGPAARSYLRETAPESNSYAQNVPDFDPVSAVSSKTRDSALRGMLDPIDPALYPLLRWIVASNRSYLRHLTNPAERLEGLGDGYLQFKMMAGSPEKEAKFSVEKNLAIHEGRDPPTLYAFHGSSLANWHSIIRTGLNFDRSVNGRAYGNGVYFSPHMATSLGFSVNLMGRLIVAGGSARTQTQNMSWKNSTLRLQHILSLVEIINRPEKFVSSTPHLVVQHTDWVETRYLLAHYAQNTAGATEGTNANNTGAVAKLGAWPAALPHGFTIFGPIPHIPSWPGLVAAPFNGNHVNVGPAANVSTGADDQFEKMDPRYQPTSVSGVVIRIPKQSEAVPALFGVSAADLEALAPPAPGLLDGFDSLDATPADNAVDLTQDDDSVQARQRKGKGKRPHYMLEDEDSSERELTRDKRAKQGASAKLSGSSSLSAALEPKSSSSSNGTSATPTELVAEAIADMPPPQHATTSATKALFKELRRMIKLTEDQPDERVRGWTIDLSSFTNLYQWRVCLTNFDRSLPLAKDLASVGLRDKGVTLEVRFSPEFPFEPPYVRVIEPRFLPFSQGGGGHITIGGSVCMDLLTSSGWVSGYTLESVLLQIRLALESMDPRPARIDPSHWNRPYTEAEAMEAYVRVATGHGWAVPANWRRYFSS